MQLFITKLIEYELGVKERTIYEVDNGTHFSPNKECTREQIVTFLWKAADMPDPETTANPFTDVKESKYYYKAILWAVENEITNGVSADKFGVGQTCTRGQIVTFLYKFMIHFQSSLERQPKVK